MEMAEMCDLKCTSAFCTETVERHLHGVGEECRPPKTEHTENNQQIGVIYYHTPFPHESIKKAIIITIRHREWLLAHM